MSVSGDFFELKYLRLVFLVLGFQKKCRLILPHPRPPFPSHNIYGSGSRQGHSSDPILQLIGKLK